MTLIRICAKVAVFRPTTPEARMYVCLCNGVTERAIREVGEAGCRTMPELTMRTGCGSSCGCCIETATRLLEEAQAAPPLPLQVLSHAA